MDRIDKKILNLLQKDNRISNQKLAETVGLSAPACLKRVKKLRESGVIMADVSIVSPQVVGHLINVIVEVEMDRDTLDVYDSFNRQMSACPEVTQCYQVTGEVDFVLVVLVPDMQTYEAFARRELASNAYLRKFRSLISLRREKFRTAIEL
ncbi:Lrp/AsnC family transcriptional regulator [Oceanospirillum sanctuarii]|uniref:Lrp/AsnC family transcriptional regulator n=1 Tax=Oceanospirillum sanctuarii TaxID=1434821 RepID=UPI000A38F6FF|nr:Lrp/AsnC family transcriptional regulator [Oceanospirillum sanctuarii]